MTETTNEPLPLVWGVKAIANIIGRTERQTFHMLSSGMLPGKKVGGRWVAERNQLTTFFLEAAE